MVISGCRGAVDAVVANLRAEGVRSRELTVSHAFHSPLMEPILDEYRKLLDQVEFAPPRFGIVSNVSGRMDDESLTTPDYWCRHVLSPVRFRDSMATLVERGYDFFLEVGPKPILIGLGRACVPSRYGVWLPSLREGRDDWSMMLKSLGEMFVHGVNVDWQGFDRDYPRRKLPLPTYAFQRKRYWVPKKEDLEPQAHDRARSAGTGGGRGAAGRIEGRNRFADRPRRLALRACLAAEAARRQRGSGRSGSAGAWLIFADRGGIGAKLAERLKQFGQLSFLVSAGERFGQAAEDRFTRRSASAGRPDPTARPGARSRRARLPRHRPPLEPRRRGARADRRVARREPGAELRAARSTWRRPWPSSKGGKTRGFGWSPAAPRPSPRRQSIRRSRPCGVWDGSSRWSFPSFSACDWTWIPAADIADAGPLFDEIWDPDKEDQVALRGTERYVARLIRYGAGEKPAPQGVAIRPDASYLITGGLGRWAWRPRGGWPPKGRGTSCSSDAARLRPRQARRSRSWSGPA